METPQLRERRHGDEERIAFVVRRAFGGEAEVNLMADLRAEGATLCEFVAVRETAGLIGHIAFSRLDVRSPDRRIEAVALAPLAVLPTHQGHGVGRALVEYGLTRIRELQIDVVIVLGDPTFYSRFGFSGLPAKLLRAPYSGEAFQALELRPGALGKRTWQVAYPPAFGKLT